MKSRKEKEGNFWNWFSGKYDRFIRITLNKTYKDLYRTLKTDLCKTDDLLEIATGTGLIAFEICNAVKSIKAMDIAPGMIKIARQKQVGLKITNIEFEVGDSYNLSYKDASFDKVLASNVLHLLYEPEKALSEIQRVLKTDGKAILPTFCHGENAKSGIISGFISLFGFSARNKWNRNSYEEFVKNHGFKIIKSEVFKGKFDLIYLVAEKN
jgi:ubiquinone/menaquinone biosynthesis C-methylase UbiE